MSEKKPQPPKMGDGWPQYKQCEAIGQDGVVCDNQGRNEINSQERWRSLCDRHWHLFIKAPATVAFVD